MNILFIHQNFPGQFKFLAPALAAVVLLECNDYNKTAIKRNV